MEILTKEYVFNLGITRGFAMSQGIEWLLPEKKLPKSIADVCGFEFVTNIVESETVFFQCAYDNETKNRDMSPFEFTAKRLNDWQEKVDWDVWKEFDSGIHEGMETFWAEAKDGINEILVNGYTR